MFYSCRKPRRFYKLPNEISSISALNLEVWRNKTKGWQKRNKLVRDIRRFDQNLRELEESGLGDSDQAVYAAIALANAKFLFEHHREQNLKNYTKVDLENQTGLCMLL